LSAYLTTYDTSDLHCGAVRPKSVGHQQFRPAIALHHALQDPQRGPAIPALAGKNLKHLAFLINGARRITSGELLK
jgi:hypothetical protein